MLNPNFYTLIGAITSAIKQLGYDDSGGDMGAGPAYGDPHLDPQPGTVADARDKLHEVLTALTDAEIQLQKDLEAVEITAGTPAERAAAWRKFQNAITEASFKFAGAMRRLQWVSTGGAASGAYGWHRLKPLWLFMLKTWAAVGLGGGHDHAAGDYPGIFGSSAESISF